MSEMAPLDVYFQKLDHGKDLPLPDYETGESAGMDIRAATAGPIHLKPGERKLIPAGFKMALPAGYEAQIRPRSGLAYRNGITMLNSPGTIDSDYRGEVKVLAINHGEDVFTIRHGDRIAQMVIAPVLKAKPQEVDKLPGTERGEGGFGSTGVQ
jgi:dUTP pyrophosphatase